VLVSDRVNMLSGTAREEFPSKILSSDAWNEGVESRWKTNVREPVLPNAFVIADAHFGHQRTFIPRLFESRTSEPRKGPGVIHLTPPDDRLTAFILGDIKQYAAATRSSLIEFLSGDYGVEAVKHELDRLETQGHIKLESKPVRSGDPMTVYTLTPSGERLLEAMHN